jgi:hypothetical protein
MKHKPEIEGMGIVFVGDFNPKIFQPAWFAANELVRKKESEESEIEIIHPSVVRFDMDWLKLQVLRNQFFASTVQEPYYEFVRDLAIGTFRILSHTPITKMGINYDFHFKTGNEDKWHDFGHRIAPKQLWESILKKPGTRTLTIEGLRPDDYKGYIRVKTEPSIQVPFGIFISINDHFELDDASVLGCEKMIDILEENWAISLKRSKQIFEQIVEAI